VTTLAGALRRPVPARLPLGLARPRASTLAVATIVLIVVVSHGYHMLRYPYLDHDEGTYFSQAWAVFHLGRLSPYTYFYDHAPLGWIQLGLWQELTGNYSFGYALASGRLFMLLAQLGSALLVFAIARRSTGKIWPGLLAASIFSLSAYGITYHRRILLDNIATFWLLLSVYMLVGRVTTLRRVCLSALALALAVLSKEVALAALPALTVLMYRGVPRPSRPFALAGWFGLSIGLCSIYVLLALLKGELLPASSGGHPHVSLICSIEWQASRGSSAGLFDGSSAFWQAAGSWAHAEPLLVFGGTAAALVSVIALRRDRVASMIGWLVLSLWLFLARGGVVLVFYLLPLLPLLALSLVLVLHAGVQRARAFVPPKLGRPAAGAAAVAVVAVCGLLLLVGYQRSPGLWTRDPVRGQVQAVSWIRTHLPSYSRMVIDEYMWSDLHEPPLGYPRYRDAQYYWNAGEDPQVQHQGFHDDWRYVEYVVATPQLLSDTATNGFPIVAPALEHSLPVARFDSGWDVEIRRVYPDAPAQFSLPRAVPKALPGCMRTV
jgi:hypothetical protein